MFPQLQVVNNLYSTHNSLPCLCRISSKTIPSPKPRGVLHKATSPSCVGFHCWRITALTPQCPAGAPEFQGGLGSSASPRVTPPSFLTFLGPRAVLGPFCLGSRAKEIPDTQKHLKTPDKAGVAISPQTEHTQRFCLHHFSSIWFAAVKRFLCVYLR